MSKYMGPDHPDAFLDWEMKEDFPIKSWVKCPLCHGYGGWNLVLNAYSLHGKEDTPKNRHLFSHFRCCCSQCNGNGFVAPDNVDCIHEWTEHRSIGRCLHEYGCPKCGKKMVVDSSD